MKHLYSFMVGIGVLILTVLLIPCTRGALPGVKVDCASNLKQIGELLLIYATENGKFPDTLQTLVDKKMAQDALLKCPVTGAPYIYAAKGMNFPADPNAVMAYESVKNHGERGMNVLFGDMHVEMVPMDKAKIITAEVEAGHNPPKT